MPLALNIVTPTGTIVDAVTVDTIVAPGSEGEFGVLEGHENFLTALEPGVLRYESGGNEERIAISDGFAEVNAQSVTVLVNSGERADEIERTRAESARERAERRLAGQGDEDDVDRDRAQLAYARALARLAILVG